MRTLSARILFGFAALTIAFAVITGTVVRNMTALEEGMVIIGKGWVPLALSGKDLERKQEELRTYLDTRFSDETNAARANQEVRRLRDKRDAAVRDTLAVLDRLDEQIEVDPMQFRVTRPELLKLQKAVEETGPTYEQLFAPPSSTDEKRKGALVQLQTMERRIKNTVSKLSERLEAWVEKITPDLVNNGHIVRMRTIYLGIVAVVLGLLVTTWVVITLRPLGRLRAAARRISAGDYASRIPEAGPAEVAELAREFNAMSKAVEERERELVRSERLAAVGKMAAMITHEVRNPLSSIGLNTELLEDELADNPEARDLCRAINREVDRLTAITEEYLAFARLPKPKIAAEAVNPMIESLATFVRGDLAQRSVQLATELGSDDPVALIDVAQLRQCLINLVRNAAEAVVAKGSGRITLRTRRDRDRVAIQVEDDGIGIAADVLPRLFDPFFSTKEGGSGLGLALTKQIVKDHGGDLEVASTVGQGTTFTVSVPVATEA